MIWLLACVGTAPPDTETVDSGGLPSLARPDLTRAWDAEQAQAAAQGTFDQGFPSPWVGLELYFWALAQGDPECPGMAEQIAPHNLQGCQAHSGWSYAGMSRFTRQVTPWEQDLSLILEADQAFGDFSLMDPSGQAFECGGHQEASVALAPDRVPVAFVGEHKGSYLWAGHEGVYREGVSGQLQVQIEGSGSEHRITLTGALEYLGQPFHSTLSLSEVCTWAPESGTLQLRDPAGAWLSWTPQACTGCGPLVDEEGAELGEVCLDFAPVAAAFAAQLAELP